MAPSTQRYRVLALDVDGTLLGPDRLIPPSTKAAVSRAAAAGLRPVICTGRRYRRARPIATELGLDAPLVCNSGALVKDPASGRTLWRADLDPQVAGAVLALFRRLGRDAVGMLDHDLTGPDFLIPDAEPSCPLFRDYVDRNREHARIDPQWMFDRSPVGHFHLFAIGDRSAMLDAERDVLELAGGRVRTFVQRSPAYQGTMCEVLDAEAGKWSALLHLLELWEIDAAEVVAVGDDQNDAPMLEGAGLGVAMNHAPESVKAVADVVLDGDHHGPALADFIADLVSRHVR